MKAMLMVLADCDLCMGRNISEMGPLLVEGSIHMKRGAGTVKCVHIILSQLMHISPVSTYIQSLWNRQNWCFWGRILRLCDCQTSHCVTPAWKLHFWKSQNWPLHIIYTGVDTEYMHQECVSEFRLGPEAMTKAPAVFCWGQDFFLKQ